MIKDPDGATPLDPEELEGLIPAGIITRSDLNAWEQLGVLEAQRWAFGPRRRTVATVLSEKFLRELHRRMFAATWNWAGKFRRSDKNIGVHWPHVPTELRKALDDANMWIATEIWPPAEIAARFHHRIVTIHPFPNGNGRWSRLTTEALMRALREPLPSWGARSAQTAAESRATYLHALRRADRGEFAALIDFVWS
jgi:Fic-DOC domain mobile mystery protein B